MRLNFLGGILAVLVVAALIVAYSSLFTVYQTQQALVRASGQPRCHRSLEPGLHVKAPFIDSVVYIDKRILDLEAPSQEVIASDQKRLVVDAFARYRIRDPLRFYQTLGSIAGANSQLSILLNSALRRVLGEVTFTHVVRDQRAELMSRIRELVDREATSYGVQVVDVRIRRADLPEQNSQAVYQRMQTERQREAAGISRPGRATRPGNPLACRSRGDCAASLRRPRSPNRVRGEGDATRNQIFAEAFGKDPDFFSFYRSMQAYERGLKQNDTRMVLKPDSSFFRYFGDPSGKLREPSASAADSPNAVPLANANDRYVGLPGCARAGFCHRRPDFRGLPGSRKKAMASVLQTQDMSLRLIGIGSADCGACFGLAGPELKENRGPRMVLMWVPLKRLEVGATL